MENSILGIHHITAIAADAKRNFDFYTRVLGLRMIKKTVNFDDPGTYHFYYGDEVGTPGTILTFFPWEGIKHGRTGTGMATNIGYSVPDNSIEFWRKRLKKFNIEISEKGTRFNEDFISFEDPDGLSLTFFENSDSRRPWETDGVKAEVATRGFHSVTLTLKKKDATSKVLTDILGFKLQGNEDNRHRYITESVEHASIIDLVEDPQEASAVNAGGTVHHIAFRVKDEATQMAYREKIVEYGLDVTPQIDRNYFFSIYFREPGGVLFEIATDNPGFDVDEPVSELGKNLKLPPQYERFRNEIVEALPVL